MFEFFGASWFTASSPNAGTGADGDLPRLVPVDEFVKITDADTGATGRGLFVPEYIKD